MVYVTGKLISKERLKIVPHATMIEAKNLTTIMLII
jgi:RNA polymerase-binding transcription factor DksA